LQGISQGKDQYKDGRQAASRKAVLPFQGSHPKTRILALFFTLPPATWHLKPVLLAADTWNLKGPDAGLATCNLAPETCPRL
jgi:hypothetical protein